MLTLDGAFTSHAAGETTGFCTLWRITRSDSTVFRFTDHDRDVVMSDGTYLASSGYVASQAQTQAGLNVDDLEVTALFDNAAITEGDLAAGVWDGATVEIFSAIWSLPSAGARMIRKGTIGQVRHDGTVEVACDEREVRPGRLDGGRYPLQGFSLVVEVMGQNQVFGLLFSVDALACHARRILQTMPVGAERDPVNG